MGIVVRQSIKSSIVSYVGIILGFISFGLILPNIISADQVGLIRWLQDAASVVATLAGLGSPYIVMRYLPFYQADKKGETLLLFYCAIISSAGIFLAALIILLFKSEIIN